MSLSSFIKKQFIDILQWTESEDGVLAWRYPMQDMEIQNGGTLVVRDSQMAMFVNEGQIADVFGAGTFKLTTQTLPVLTYLKNWDKLFESPFKSDVYYFSTRQQLGRRWGTPQPVTVRDKDFGMIRLRAFGVYAYHVADPKLFYQQVSGTRDIYTVDEVEAQLGPVIMGAMATAFGESGVPFLDLAANQTLMSNKVRETLAPQFTQYGLALDSFQVSSVTLPDELQAAMDRRISMDMTGDMGRFTQYQAAESLPLAAQNEGGIAGTGAGLAAGLAMGQTMAESLRTAVQGGAGSATPAAAQPAAAAPVAPAADDPTARLTKLKDLLDKGLITQADFDAGKAAVLKALTGGWAQLCCSNDRAAKGLCPFSRPFCCAIERPDHVSCQLPGVWRAGGTEVRRCRDDGVQLLQEHTAARRRNAVRHRQDVCRAGGLRARADRHHRALQEQGLHRRGAHPVALRRGLLERVVRAV